MQGSEFEPRQRHYVVSVSMKYESLFSSGLSQEVPSRNYWKNVDWFVKN